MTRETRLGASWTLAAAAILFVGLGTWALRLQAQQARDTIRKHDLEDLEQALYRAARVQGSYPPEETATWCGTLSAPESAPVRMKVETALRRSKKYEKPDKPFPTDPVLHGTERDYFYWKTSPVSFELLAHLEADDNNSRTACGRATPYDYSVVSTLRTPY